MAKKNSGAAGIKRVVFLKGVAHYGLAYGIGEKVVVPCPAISSELLQKLLKERCVAWDDSLEETDGETDGETENL